MAAIKTIEELREIYKMPQGRSVTKQLDRFETHSRRFIELSPFLVMATQAPNGLGDATPRGEAPGFVHVLDDHRIAIPDRPGNNRLDTMTNIIANPAVSLIFLLPGVAETLRVNGRGEIRTDADLLDRFTVNDKPPITVLVVTAEEVYFHCAKALIRARLWEEGAQASERPIPSMSQMINEQTHSTAPVESDADMLARYRKVLY